jgi:hypothetical protein
MSITLDPTRVSVPPLVEGQRLRQAEFHARYEAMPPGTRAELIGGVVYMPSPVTPGHGDAHVPILVWLHHYSVATPGLQVLDNTSTALDDLGELQPDAQLRVRSDYGGRTRSTPKLIAGAPELIAEVSKTTRYVDLGPKLQDYERAGVLEYIVRAFDPEEVIWHVLREGRLLRIPPGEGGLYRSEVFSGLWLDPQALIRGDWIALQKALDAGLATPEHAAFVARLAEAGGTA